MCRNLLNNRFQVITWQESVVLHHWPPQLQVISKLYGDNEAICIKVLHLEKAQAATG